MGGMLGRVRVCWGGCESVQGGQGVRVCWGGCEGVLGRVHHRQCCDEHSNIV